MGLVLQHIFDAKNPVLVMLMALVLTTLGAYEAVYNVSKRRHVFMFPSVLGSMATSCLIIGTFALGMLLGNTMTAISLGLDQCLSQLSEHKERIELYLSMGATRWEACRPIAVEAMRRALMPTINQTSIIGLISIPGMMTGQLIAGASVMNAVKSQQIIMFLICGAAAFGTLSSVLICLRVCFDSSDRLRPERIYKATSIVPNGVREVFRRIGDMICCCWYSSKARKDPRSGSASPSLEQGNGAGRNGRNGGRNSPRVGSGNGSQNGTVQRGGNQEPTERTPLVR
ncbi:hypothetical protein BGX31_007116 [Mortierella sp. GBA43]|nr:hypothetical protein BGX31_007116 [Mortierella sp. GBA43]